jgi:hypothetical protein
MESRVLGEMAAGRGLVTSVRLRELGFSPRQIAAWVRSGALVAVRRGVYTTAEVWAGWDEFRDRPLARIRAAHLTLVVPHVFSHDSAALLHGLPLLRPQDAAVHVTRPDVNGSRTRYGVRHHGAAYATSDVVVVDGLATLGPARTVADIARTHGYRPGLVAADGALHLGVSRPALAAAYASMGCWPGVTDSRAVVEDADPGAESAGETLARELVKELGIGAVETQFPVRVRSGVRWCDLRVGCHIFEFDGWLKFRAPERGGVASEGVEQALWDERKRQQEICAEGLGVSRLIWDDFWGAARDRAKRRLLREFAVTEARFGPTLPTHLEESARRLRGRRHGTPTWSPMRL